MTRKISVLINRVQADLPITKGEADILNKWADSKIKEQRFVGVFVMLISIFTVFGALAYAVFNT